jgi:flagellin-like hook-associated protein FlgL
MTDDLPPDNDDIKFVEPEADGNEESQPSDDNQDGQLAVRKPRRKPPEKAEDEWAQVVVIRRGGEGYREKVAVPINEVANKAAAQLLVAKTRKAFMSTMDRYQAENRTLEPKQWVDLANAAKVLTELSMRVYGDNSASTGPSSAGMATALGAAVGSAIKATADAVNKGGDHIIERVDDVYARIEKAKAKIGSIIVDENPDEPAEEK